VNDKTFFVIGYNPNTTASDPSPNIVPQTADSRIDDALLPVADVEGAEVVAEPAGEPVVEDDPDEPDEPDELDELDELDEPVRVARAASDVNVADSPVTFLQAEGTSGFLPLLKLTAAHYALLGHTSTQHLESNTNLVEETICSTLDDLYNATFTSEVGWYCDSLFTEIS
jgi:hypothetical protein